MSDLTSHKWSTSNRCELTRGVAIFRCSIVFLFLILLVSVEQMARAAMQRAAKGLVYHHLKKNAPRTIKGRRCICTLPRIPPLEALGTSSKHRCDDGRGIEVSPTCRELARNQFG